MNPGIVDSMVGVIPIALAGGITLSLTNQALRMPGRIQAEAEQEQETMRRKKRAGRRSGDIWETTFGIRA